MRTLSLGAGLLLVLLLAISGLAVTLLYQFPSDREIRGCMTTKLYQVRLCPDEPNYTRLSEISEYLQKAVILTEDSAFFSHRGFDFQEMENSLKKNIEKGRFARGGSTISQQLVKNLFLTKEKTLQRKILEALITLRMEKVLSKREILEKYLNTVQFGKDLFGVKQAAHFYFKKSPARLSVTESAFLAFLLPSPENYSKSYFEGQLTPFARKRLAQIIERLYTYNRITEDEYRIAQGELDYFLKGEVIPTEQNFEDIQEETIDVETNFELEN